VKQVVHQSPARHPTFVTGMKRLQAPFAFALCGNKAVHETSDCPYMLTQELNMNIFVIFFTENIVM